MLTAHKTRDYDAVFTNWVLDNFQVGSAPYALFHSSQADIEMSANRSSVRMPALDRAINAAVVATDPTAQKAAWRDFTQTLQQEQPVTFIFWLKELAAVRNEVAGVEMDARGEFRTLRNWTVSK